MRMALAAWPEVDPAMVRIIETMPLRWRNVLVLTYGHGLTQEECAERLGLSPRTVQRTVSELCHYVAAILEAPPPASVRRDCASVGWARWDRGC